jgi:hypothetical protein
VGFVKKLGSNGTGNSSPPTSAPFCDFPSHCARGKPLPLSWATQTFSAPYLKTGIYHPEWHLTRDGQREAFDREHPVATNKVIYVTDVKVGSEQATYETVLPIP